MFPQKLYQSNTSKTLPDPKFPQFRMDDFGYGKEHVRVMALVKDGPYHTVKEFSVTSHMKLATHKEYYEADNTDIIGSDVQEVNIFLHAKKHGLGSPEDFALTLTQHFLDTYPIVSESHVRVEEKPWERLNGEHNHAFSMSSTVKRFCDVVRKRSDPEPLVMSGIDGLRIIKTAQAPFVGYIKAGLHTEGDQPDRVLCADILAKWQYSTLENVDLTTSWQQVKDLILKAYAGDPKTGVTTTSVQYISYEAEKLVLSEVPQISSITVALPNIRYADFDFSRFAEIKSNVKNLSIYQTAEVPNGIGFSKLDRLDCLSKSKM
ncbi:uricase-like [Episyrphus balteatus]|uniref:uricase-like n=1 Tax=Episyrphus balteatus TaxID=286459 RepID=UPI002484F275|nr:uricase-like [Episyrphus balteatus]